MCFFHKLILDLHQTRRKNVLQISRVLCVKKRKKKLTENKAFNNISGIIISQETNLKL